MLPPAQLGQRLCRGRGQCSKTAELCRAVEIRPKVAKTERSVICDLSHSNGSGSGNSLHYMIFMQSSNRLRGLKTACRHAQVSQGLSVHLTCTVWLDGKMIANHEQMKSQGWGWSWRKLELHMYCHRPSLKECLLPKCRNQSTLISNLEHLWGI